MIEFTFKKDELKKMIDASSDDYVNVSVTVNFAPSDGNKVFPATILATLAKSDSSRSTAAGDSVRGCPIPPNCT
jgi:NADP-dependent 3-hydroxy acid dehydrogenase YdfG